MSTEVAAEPPTIVRRNYGRSHVYFVDDEKSPGATTIINGGYPKPALPPWYAKTCANVVLNEWDVLAELRPSERFEHVKSAPSRERDAAARRGTEVHTYALKKLAGDEEVEVPDELVGHVDAYLDFVEDWQPRELYVEASIASTRRHYSGTLDVIADLADGNRWLYDLKTNRSGVFRESALQLAAYRYADWIVGADGVVVPMPEVDRCGVLWLRDSEPYEFTPVDVTPTTHRVFLYAKQIHDFGDRAAVNPIGEALRPPEVAA